MIRLIGGLRRSQSGSSRPAMAASAAVMMVLRSIMAGPNRT